MRVACRNLPFASGGRYARRQRTEIAAEVQDMPDTSPAPSSARTIAADIAAGRTSAREVIVATLARAHAVQDRLNCFTLILPPPLG